MTTYQELLSNALSNKPNSEWLCEKCNNTNSNWIIDIKEMLKSKEIKFIHGVCTHCEAEYEKYCKNIDNEYNEYNKIMCINNIIKKSKIPPKIINSNFNNIIQHKENDAVFSTFKKLEKADRWIYLFGDNNTGKTMIIGASINDLSEKLIPSYYFNERQLFRRLKETYSGSDESEKDIYDSIKETQIIFWDDFSTMPYTTWEKGVAYDIMEYCDTYYKIIIFISNINFNEQYKTNKEIIEQRIGKRAIARMIRNKLFSIKMKNKPFFS
jgi:DNA replication protein DnaC